MVYCIKRLSWLIIKALSKCKFIGNSNFIDIGSEAQMA